MMDSRRRARSGTSSTAARPSSESARQEYFLPGEGIHPPVLGAFVRAYLGEDAEYWGGYSTTGSPGFYTKASGLLTTNQIGEIKLNTVNYFGVPESAPYNEPESAQSSGAYQEQSQLQSTRNGRETSYYRAGQRLPSTELEGSTYIDPGIVSENPLNYLDTFQNQEPLHGDPSILPEARSPNVPVWAGEDDGAWPGVEPHQSRGRGDIISKPQPGRRGGRGTFPKPNPRPPRGG